MGKIYLSPTNEQEVEASKDSSTGRKFWKAQQKINERLDTAEFKLNPTQIVLTVRNSTEYQGDISELQSQIDITAGQIALKVSATDYNGNTIASLINQTATTIKLSASKINLDGYVTFTNLSSAGGTAIDGANITTGTINANRIVAGYLVAGSIGGWSINNSTISRAGITLGNDYISLGNAGTTGSTINLGSAKIYNIGGGGVGISSYLTVGADISPQNDNGSSLGSSYARFKEVWAVDGSINTSDVSDKKDIRTLTNGDAFDLIMQLNPVKFKWVGRNRNHYGFLAQDVKHILDQLGIDFGLYIDPSVNGQEGYKGLRYHELIAPLVYTVQLLNTRIEELKNEIKDLRTL